MKKRKKEIIVLLAVFICGLLGAILGRHLADVENEKALKEAFDTAERTNAVDFLNQRKGKFQEIQFLAYGDVSQDILREELKRLYSFDYYENPYLKEIVLYPPETSNVEDICEEIISQIDDHIRRIRYGKKDEQSSFFLLI